MQDLAHPILGLDLGTARVGVAATDPAGIMAHPVETIQVAQIDPIERVVELIASRNIQRVIIGLPLHMDGREGVSAARSRDFAEQLQSRLPELPIELEDETLTTVMAADKLHAAGKNARSQKNIIDQAAAVEILEAWLARNSPPTQFPS